MDHSTAGAKCFAGGGEWLGPSLAAARQLAMRSSQPVEGTLTTGDSSDSRADRQGKRQDPWRVLEQLPDVRVSGGSHDSGKWGVGASLPSFDLRGAWRSVRGIWGAKGRTRRVTRFPLDT